MQQGSEEHLQYMREYSKKRYEQRIKDAIAFLGGKCTKCGVMEDLNFDHIDGSTKTANVTSITRSKEEVFWDEVRKCQLLCIKCHEEKTLTERGQESAKTAHGTLSSYRYCKCEKCTACWKEYMRNYRGK